MKLFARRAKDAGAPVAASAERRHRVPRVVWGATWVPVEPTVSSPLLKVARAEARKRGASVIAVASNGQDAAVGMPAKGKGSRTTGPSGKGNGFLAAQLLSTVRLAKEVSLLGEDSGPQNNPWHGTEHVAYLGALDDATYVFVATVHGVPLLDICGDVETISKGIQEFREHLVSGAALLIQDSRPVAKAFSALPSEFPAIATPVHGLPFAAGALDAAGGLQPLGMHPVVKGAIATAAVAGVGVGLMWAYDAYVGHALSVEQLTRKEQQAKVLRQKYLAAQQDVLAKESSVVASAAAEPVWAFIAKTRLSRAGFNLTKVVCTGNTCDLQYRRDTKVPTFTDFVRTHGQGELPRFDIAQLDDAVTGLEVPEYDKMPKVDLANIKFDPELLLKLGTTAQKVLLAGVKLGFTTPADMVAMTDEFKTMRPVELAASRRLYGTWTLEGPTDTFTAALKRLPPTATLSMVEVRLSRSEKDGPDLVVAKGRYFLTPVERVLQ
ncbi:hypothetical protein [Ramlibacter albus]|uniref:Uncharacterized protein n=1 Tax=Ramlibacter albus TaxID=2079448 RepID=A0A923MBK3_9BURK|nr:hypothetical protein [Ramlibacter albus]MBC5767640.1 hypothetical protein [Ramlibacter albus]